jgi:hypothetical protein
MNSETDAATQPLSGGTSRRTSALKVALWWGLVGGLALPLALWAVMAGSPALGTGVGLGVGLWANRFLTMFWPTSIALISPALGPLIIAILLSINMLVYGLLGFGSTKLLYRPLGYYALLIAVLVALLLSSGSFIWIAPGASPVPFDVIDLPSFAIAATLVTVVFVLRRHWARQKDAGN